MKKIHLIIIAGIMLLPMACGKRPDFMEHEVLFTAALGEDPSEIGSNIPLLEDIISDDEQFLVGDYLDVPFSFQIHKNRLFVADKYNEWISIFDLNKNQSSNIIIPSQGNGYAFSVPFQVSTDKYGEVYVVASSTNDNTNDIYAQYYIYKFSSTGKFIYKLGEDGLNTGPMYYPDRIDTDLFDNLYVYFLDYSTDSGDWKVKRFSPSGELTFKFDTRYRTITNVIGNEKYLGRITDVYNLQNDERLLIYSTHRVIERDGVEISTPDKFYNSLDIYSILQNKITENILTDAENIEGLLGVTQDDEIVLYGYDMELDAVRFRFINIYGDEEEEKEKVYYAPVLSPYYIFIDFFMDANGEIYSSLVKDNEQMIVLHWIK